MKLLLINSTNSAFRICKKWKRKLNCRPRQECSQFVGFYRAAPQFLNRTIVYCSMRVCCYFHFRKQFNYSFNFNCSLNHFWAKQQQRLIRMAKLHKSFTITVTLVVCFVHFSNVVFMFFMRTSETTWPSRVCAATEMESEPSRRDADLQHAPLLIKNSNVPALGGSTAHHVILLL